MSAALILAAVRTPVGRAGGALAGVRPDDLAACAVRAAVDRVPGLDPELIDDVLLGDANQAGEDNRNVARMAVLLAGLPVTVPGATVNRLCGSGLEAVIQGARAIETGDASLVVAGGTESMSRAPWVVRKPERAFPRGDETMVSTTLGWRLVNPRLPAEWTVSLGEGAEIAAERFGVSRAASDAFALRSHRQAAAAWAAGRFDAEVVPVDDERARPLIRDEAIRLDASLEALAALRPVFRPDGTVTAGNASPLNDAAAALVLADEAAAGRTDATPLARIVSRAVTGIEPPLYGVGPVDAGRRALARAGLGFGDLEVVELNEAFAGQALACLSQWPELDPERVNPNGGAIAIGHPLGGSGARLLATLVHELRRRGGGFGLAAMCIGVGQGIAVVVEA